MDPWHEPDEIDGAHCGPLDQLRPHRDVWRDAGDESPVIRIRAGVVPEDVESCAQLWVRALAHRDGAVETRAMAQRVRSAFANPIVRFAVAVSPFAGFAVTESGREDPAEALLHFLAVDPRTPAHGLGTALLADAVEHAAASDFAVLVLDVRVDNARAIRLYERAGFAPEGEPRPHPLGGQPMQPYRLRLR